MSSRLVLGRVDFRFRSLRRRLSIPFSSSRLHLRPPRRPFPIHLRWHRAWTPRCRLPSPRTHVGTRARLPNSSDSAWRALLHSVCTLSLVRFSVCRRRLPPLRSYLVRPSTLSLSSSLTLMASLRLVIFANSQELIHLHQSSTPPHLNGRLLRPRS